MTRWPVTIVILLVAGCMPATPTPPAAAGTLQVEVVAGPVCPVEQDPPDPNCEPRPVDGARIFVQQKNIFSGQVNLASRWSI